MENVHHVYLSLGSNLGDRASNIRRAVELIGERIGQVARLSSLLDTEPWGFHSEHRFLNAAVLCLTEKTPREVLQLTQQIERDMGRRKCLQPTAQGVRAYADRTIDIDILLYDDLHVDEADLHIPHPLMHERDFVMKPLEEIRDQ